MIGGAGTERINRRRNMDRNDGEVRKGGEEEDLRVQLPRYTWSKK